MATELAEEGSKAARELQGKILAAIPRFEEGENVRTFLLSKYTSPLTASTETETKGVSRPPKAVFQGNW